MDCRMKRIAILLSLLLPLGLQAEEVATINIRKGDTTSVALATLGGGDGPAATKVLQNDLQLSGWFSVTAPDRASYTISGTAAGGTLQGKVADQRGSVVLQKSYSGDTRSATHQFADDIVETLTGHKGIATSKIAFVSNRSGKKEIYTADYDGANVRQLTHDNNISVAPAISADGRKLAYTGYASGYADIYAVDLGSGARNRIIKFPGTNSGAAFSPDGGKIACTLSKDGNPELYVLGAGGGSGEMISTGYGYCTEPSWSPDGKKLAFTVRQGGFQIAVKDLQGGSTNIVAQTGQDPAWGADSRHLIFSNGSSIVLLDTQNGRQTPVISGLGGVSEPSWSH